MIQMIIKNPSKQPTMQKVILEKTIKEEIEMDFPIYFKHRRDEEYYMFSGGKRYISVEVNRSHNSAYISCTTMLTATQLQACLKYCDVITQQDFIEGYKTAESIIRNEITNACKMELYELE